MSYPSQPDPEPGRHTPADDNTTRLPHRAPPTPATATPIPPADTEQADQSRIGHHHQEPAVIDAPTVIETETAEPHGDVLAQEKAQFGGIKIGAALLGWLTTVGTIAVLAAIAAAVAGGLNIDANTSTQNLSGAGLATAIVLLVIAFLGYLAGGYVAGRMARFHGIRQGLAVWLWGLVIAIVLSIVAAIAPDQSTILVRANLPKIPFTSDGFTWKSILALLAVLIVTLIGALLGGLLGMRFHRRIDRFAADATSVEEPIRPGNQSIPRRRQRVRPTEPSSPSSDQP